MPAAEARSPRARALEIFREGRSAYEKGEFAAASALLQQAYEIHPEPVLLYDLGRVFESMGELERAKDAYARFLLADPGAVDRGAIEKRIETLGRQIAEKNRPSLDEKVAEKNRPKRDEKVAVKRSVSLLPWVVAGVGVGGLGAGIVLGQVSLDKHDAAASERQVEASFALQRDAKNFATASNVCLVAGGVIALGGTVWGLVDIFSNRSSKSTSRTTFDAGPSGVRISKRF